MIPGPFVLIGGRRVAVAEYSRYTCLMYPAEVLAIFALFGGHFCHIVYYQVFDYAGWLCWLH